jgi:hypothetical protein
MMSTKNKTWRDEDLLLAGMIVFREVGKEALSLLAV